MNFFQFKTHEAVIINLSGTNKPLTDYINTLYTQYLVDPFKEEGYSYTKLNSALNVPDEFEESDIIGILYSYKLINYAIKLRKSKMSIKRKILNTLDTINKKLLNICHKTVPIDLILDNKEHNNLTVDHIKTIHRAQEHLTSTDPDFMFNFYVSYSVINIGNKYDRKHVLAIYLDKVYETPNQYLQKLLYHYPQKGLKINDLIKEITQEQLMLDSINQYIKEVE